MQNRFSVNVPATSGNLGPGFDVLGMALDFYNELYVESDGKPGALRIEVHGEGVQSVPRDQSNVIYQALSRVFKAAKKKVPSVKLVCVNRIPLTRGLGSSSAALLSGLLAGNRLLGNKFSRNQILNWATEMEGHPDNVAPALLGGIQASAWIDGSVLTSSWPVPKLDAVVAIPKFELSTKKARAILPRLLPMKDAIANLSYVALMRDALSMQYHLLPSLLNDQWHEPYRAKLVPGFYQVKRAALKAGALGVILSGAGPTMLSFAFEKDASVIASAMKKAFSSARVECETKILSLNRKGAVIQ